MGTAFFTRCVAAVAATVCVAVIACVHAAHLPYTGITSSCAEFGETQLPGVLNTDYRWPEESTYSYFSQRGMNVIRLAFMWERLQPQLNGPLDPTYSAALAYHVGRIIAAGHYAVLDPHNFARYRGSLIGSAAVPDAAFVDFWQRVSQLLPQSKVIYSLMNEPNTMSTEQWFLAAQKAIDAIRASGRTNLILVPGNNWTGAWSWTGNSYGTSNSLVSLSITDPANNFAFEVHQYFDADFSGGNAACPSTDGVARFSALTAWAKQNGRRVFVGELGGGNNDNCKAAVTSVLQHLEANSDVYIGWLWWAAGPWWSNYFLSLEPGPGNTDKPQLAWLTPFLAGSGATAPPPSPTPSSAAPTTTKSPTTATTGTNTLAPGATFPVPATTNTNAGAKFSIPIKYTSSSSKVIVVDILSTGDNVWYGKGAVSVGVTTAPTTIQISITIQTALPSSKTYYLHAYIVDAAKYNANQSTAYMYAVAVSDTPISVRSN